MKKELIYEDLMRIFYQELMESNISVNYIKDNYGLDEEHLKVLNDLKEEFGGE